MARPIKEISCGQVKCAVFQGEYDGKPTFSFKFQKSYKKDDEWVNTDYFNPIDLRSMLILVTKMTQGQIKERTPEPEQTSQEPEPEEDLPF